MSQPIETENINLSVNLLISGFAGRKGMIGYNADKMYHIHFRNRAYVWKKEMQEKLLDSILKGYPIPPIYCEEKFVEGRQRREIMDGGNRITTLRMILNNEVRPLTDQERLAVSVFPITIVVLRGLTSTHRRELFRRLNKSVKVSDGQLYMMSLDDSPLIQSSYSLLHDDNHPLRERITQHFFDTRESDAKDDSKKNLANAVALVSGCVYGVNYLTKSFQVQEEKVESRDPIPLQQIIDALTFVIDIFEAVDEDQTLSKKSEKSKQWTIGYLMGIILYDYHTFKHQLPLIHAKWKIFIMYLRLGKDQASEAIVMAGGQNLTAGRYAKLSKKVEIYLRDEKIATKEELDQYIRVEEDEYKESESDDESLE